MLPSISIDDGVLRHCSLVAFAEVLDYFKGIERFSGTAVGLRLQKFWIISVESNVVGPGTALWLALWHQVSPGMSF